MLVTQCLQNDFVKPILPGEALPNLLHVGHEESRRLLGEDPSTGPAARFMQWVNSEKDLHRIHIRDWHDPTDSQQASHLQQFGNHCIRDTEGAQFIFELPKDIDHALVSTTTLNDFADTNLAATLDNIYKQAKQSNQPVQLGLIGVWTEAKILFLAYEISTRYPEFQIAVCSALTASSSRSQHFLALQQLDRIVGATIIDSVGEFIQFLGGDGTKLADIKQHLAINKTLQLSCNSAIDMRGETEDLIRYLFRDCQRIDLKVLDGGFSGNLVAGVNSIDMHGHEQTPHVIKIGRRDLMARERTAFEQIESVLGNNAPRIADYVDGQDKGAIKYRYASMTSGATRSLQQCIQSGESVETIKGYLDAVFDQQLGRFYRAAVNDKQDLLKYYCFDSSWADSVKHKMEALLGSTLSKGWEDKETIALPGGKPVYNLYQFYRRDLDKLPPMVGDYPFAFVHGDLNGANIIIDERDNVWLIDFFHTHRGHVLKDFAKLENDLLYIYTSIDNEVDLQLAYQFTDYIVGFNHPFGNLPNLPEDYFGTQFERTYAILRYIRELARKVIGENQADMRKQYLVAQLRYAVHTVGFDEPNELQRIWALYTSCVVSNLIPK